MSLLKQADDLEVLDDDDERRVAPRTKTLKRGKVMFNNMSSTFDCIVRNISATGALLTLDEQAHLPREFDIRIGDEKLGRPASLVYRRGMLAGIHFRDVASAETAPPQPTIREPVPSVPPADPAGDGVIRKLAGELLPFAVTSRFRWVR